MSRPTDWSPLAPADPTPGEQSDIRRVSRRYRDFAAELEQQAANLNRLATEAGWKAGAAQAFSSTATDVAGQLTKAKERYRSVGEALNTYANELAQAQSEADAALREAKQAEADHQAKTAIGGNPAMQGPVAPSRAGGAEEPPPLDISGPAGRLRRAVEQRDAAGRRASSRIREAISDDGMRDNWWDKVKDWSGRTKDSFIDWVHNHADIIKKVADIAGDVAFYVGMIGMGIGMVPGLNVLAPAFMAVAALATVVSLGANLMLALSGDGNWLDVGLDVIGLVTFGFGRGATRAVVKGQRLLKGSATKAAISQARAGLAGKLTAGLRESTKKAGIARVEAMVSPYAAGGTEAKLAATAGRFLNKADQVVGKIPGGKQVKSFVGGKLLGVDGEVAIKTSQARDLAQLAPDTREMQAALSAVEKGNKVVKITDKIQAPIDRVDYLSDDRRQFSLDEAVEKRKAVEKATTFGRYASASQ